MGVVTTSLSEVLAQISSSGGRYCQNGLWSYMSYYFFWFYARSSEGIWPDLLALGERRSLRVTTLTDLNTLVLEDALWMECTWKNFNVHSRIQMYDQCPKEGTTAVHDLAKAKAERRSSSNHGWSHFNLRHGPFVLGELVPTKCLDPCASSMHHFSLTCNSRAFI